MQAPPPRAPWDANAGLGLIYNGMIAPMGSFGLTGVAWYQGESDAGVPGYGQRLTALFKGWRGRFGRADLPMLVVQLPNFGPVATAPMESGWAMLRNDQREAVDADAHAALTVTLDLGDRSNLHPLDKAPVGARLARAAGTLVYGETRSAGGPAILDARRDGRFILLHFKGVTGALHSWSDARPSASNCAARRSPAARYAQATAVGDTVLISDDGQPATRVRYAWAESPVVNLFDEAELPVSTFETAIAP